MLETYKSDDVNQLLNKDWIEIKAQSLDIHQTQAGDLVKIVTASSNTYVFEITDPAKCMAKVFRCEARENAPTAGYLGERFLPWPVINIGKIFWHGSSNTSPVRSIAFVSPEF